LNIFAKVQVAVGVFLKGNLSQSMARVRNNKLIITEQGESRRVGG